MVGFMKITGADGDATEQGYEKWIKITSFSEGVSRPVSSSASSRRSTDVASLSDMQVTKEFDKSSLNLFKFACAGKMIDEVEIHMVTSVGDNKPTPKSKIKLKNVLVTSYTMSSAFDGSNRPLEAVSLNYSKIEWAYMVMKGEDNKAGGQIDASWNIATNAPQ